MKISFQKEEKKSGKIEHKTPSTIVVTGAGGFVGSHLARKLISDGLHVLAIDLNLKNCERLPRLGQKDKLALLEADFTDNGDLRIINKKIKSPCYLVHLGGYMFDKLREISKYDALRSVDTNITGTYKLIKLLKPKLTGVCLASTVDVYGTQNSLPIKENIKPAPDTFYGASKLAMELYTKIELSGKTPLAILRFSHIYGHGDTHRKVLMLFIKAVQSEKRPVIYGDGSDLRDYIHIDDTVEVIKRAIYTKANGIFNIATGKSYSLNELSALIIKLSRKKLSPIYMSRQEPPKDYSFDISKMNNELGFYPAVSIEQGISVLLNS